MVIVVMVAVVNSDGCGDNDVAIHQKHQSVLQKEVPCLVQPLVHVISLARVSVHYSKSFCSYCPCMFTMYYDTSLTFYHKKSSTLQ